MVQIPFETANTVFRSAVSSHSSTFDMPPPPAARRDADFLKRWCFYVLLIWSGVLLAMIIFLVPETFSKVLLRKKAQRLRKSTRNDQWYAQVEKMDRSISQTVIHSCYRPFKLLFLGANVPESMSLLFATAWSSLSILRRLPYCLWKQSRIQHLASRLDIPGFGRLA